jgi:LytS/YehU family sensor histidine kinase
VAEKEYEVEWRNVQMGSITIFAHSHEKAQEIVRAMSLPELE